MFSRTKVVAGFAAAALFLTACTSDSGTDSDGTTTAASGDDAYSIGINQLVQHPALDAATAGFKEVLDEAGVEVTYDEQNANGEQATAQNITDIPVLFTAVTDPVSAELVDSEEAPGGNVTGTSDVAPIEDQLDLLKEIVPDAQSIGIVYASGEVNSQVQVDAVQEAAGPRDLEVVTQTVTTANDIQQAVEALGDVDAIYVPTDNMVVAGIASLVQVAEQKQIPVIAAEAGTVEGGAVATLGIDYTELGRQTGEMALRILQDGEDPASMAVEKATEFTYVINEDAAERLGVTIPQEILDEAETV